MRHFFQRFATRTADAAGTPLAFLAALTIVIVWAISGPAMRYSDGWMLVINTLTTIITFLMVFVIQASQNRDARIARIERQSILRAIADAPDTLIGLERDPEERIDELAEELQQCREEAEES